MTPALESPLVSNAVATSEATATLDAAATLDATATPDAGAMPDAGVIEEARARQRRHRAVAAAAVSLVALGVGVAVWGLAGGGGSHARSAGRAPAPVPLRARGHARASCAPVFGRSLRGAPSRSLLSILAVLRRPQRPTDSLPSGTGHAGDPFSRYVRRTRVVAGSSYYIYPARYGCQPGQVGIMHLATHVDLGHGFFGAGGGGGVDAAEIEAGHAASTGPPGSNTSATITMIVPDGVATVTLRYPAGRASGYSPKVSPPFTVTTAPVENEVVVSVPRSAGGGPIWQPTMIWRAANGHVLRTFHRL